MNGLSDQQMKLPEKGKSVRVQAPLQARFLCARNARYACRAYHARRVLNYLF
jgi:hypothetical protein